MNGPQAGYLNCLSGLSLEISKPHHKAVIKINWRRHPIYMKRVERISMIMKMMMVIKSMVLREEGNPSSPPPPSRLSPLVAKQYSRRGDKVNRNGYRKSESSEPERAVEGWESG